MEILAPAGSRDSLEAAVRSGTDAVYLGTSAFNARRNADNFDSFSLREAVEYCHARHVSVYVTLNTVIFDSEREAFIRCAEEVAEAGPDRVIVQDLGCIKYIREVCADMPVCASTQMAVHNVSGAKALEKLGIFQAVLARELTLDEIRKIRSETGLRLETFVHGAHCMSVSGNCYFSQALGERSGNRGLCAQPCRLNFACKGRSFALSLKDLSFVNHVKELESAGVSALKIEGRMKRPEYVAAAVNAVKKALAGEAPDMEGLKDVFSRSGFTDGYLIGRRNASMFGIRSEADVQSSKQVLGKMADIYRHEYKHVPVVMRLEAGKDVISLTVSDKTNTVSATSPTMETETGILTKEIAERALLKTGGTPFLTEKTDIILNDSLHVQSSVVNELRRRALEELLRSSAHGIPYHINDAQPSFVNHCTPEKHSLRLRFSKYEQMPSEIDADLLILPISEIEKNIEVLSCPVPVSAELPVLVYPGKEAALWNTLYRLKEKGLKHVHAGNIGFISELSENGFIVHGGYTLNITNSDALATYRDLGLSDAVLSPELTLKQAGSFGNVIPCGVFSYGRLPLMYFRSCPARTEKGCGTCNGRPEVTDNRKTVFPLYCMDREYSVMYNSVSTYLGDFDLQEIDFSEVYFSFESRHEVENIIRLIRNGNKAEFAFTRGHALKPVR